MSPFWCFGRFGGSLRVYTPPSLNQNIENKDFINLSFQYFSLSYFESVACGWWGIANVFKGNGLLVKY
jgi:hypothetical protein